MVLTLSNLALVLGLTLVAGLASGVLSLGRLRRANPADLY
jgi:ABC-type antimicrobial peptide transport system permease subunit